MRMCKRRMLSFVLALVLVAGCFAGTGISVKAADVEENVVVLATAVFEDVPVEGVEFELRDTTKTPGDEGYIAAKITSDKDGKLKCNVKNIANGMYRFIISESAVYTSFDAYDFTIQNGNIIRVDSTNWTGNENLKFDLAEKPDPAKQSITIKLVDEPGGALVTDSAVKLQVMDYYSDDDNNPYTSTEEPVNGEYTYTVASDSGVKIVIGLDKDVKGYEANPIELRLRNSMIDKVIIDGVETVYDGTPQEMVVTPVGLTANITEVIAMPNEIPANGGEVQLSITGTDTTAANWGVEVQSVISGTEQKPGDKAGQAVVEKTTKKNAVIKISENETEDKIDFIFSAGPKGEEGNITKQASVKVTQAGKVQDNDKPQNPDDKPQNPDDKPQNPDDKPQNPDDKPQTPGNDKPQDDNKPALPETIKVSSIKLSAASKEIAVGKKIKLTTKVFPANATNKSVTYKSSNTKYASVDGTGKVTVKKAGAGKTVTITATAADGSGKSASYKIKIMKSAVKSIKVKAAKSVKAGKKVKAKVTVKTTGKNANKKLKWTSSNTKYATVSSKGVIKTKKAGRGKTVKITAAATDGSGKKSTVKIKIK